MNLPPPDMTMPGLYRAGTNYYSADTVLRLLAAERERCAKVVEAMRILPGRDFSSSDAAEINGMGRAFAAAIRSAE